jgi:hypothetical protein
LSDRRNEDPTATIVYQGVKESDIAAIQAQYPIGRAGIQIYNLLYGVDFFEYTRQRVVYRTDTRINLYQVTVKLRSKRIVVTAQSSTSQAATSTSTSSSGTVNYWEFQEDLVINDGANTLGKPTGGYNNAELTFGGQQQQEQSQTIVLGPTKTFAIAPPVTISLTESDIDPTRPPENSTVLKDHTSNFDESGPKKVTRSTTRIDGVPSSEIVKTYGFAYTLSDIGSGASAGSFWTQIEEQNSQYLFQQAGQSALTVNITDPAVTGGGSLSVIVHPDYTEFADVEFSASGQSVVVKSNAEYLVQIRTTGWQLVRLAKENQYGDGRNTLDPGDPLYQYYFFQRVSLSANTVYALAPARGQFGEAIAPPFAIELQTYDQLDPRIQLTLDPQDVSKSGKVAVIIPDINYVEPFYVQVEGSASNSFLWAPNPDKEAEPGKPPPRLISGQESRTEVTRQLTAPNFYTEKESRYSSSDPGFDNSIEEITFRDVSGQPPSATTRLSRIEEKPISPNQITVTSAQQGIKYFITTPATANDISPGSSVNVPEATSLSGALNILNQQLLESNLQVNKASKTIAWFFPQIKAGDFVQFENDRFADKGSWLVLSRDISLNYQGSNNALIELLVTCEGTQLQLGMATGLAISVRTEFQDPPQPSVSYADPIVSTSLEAAPGSIGSVLPGLSNRRNF